MVVTLSTFCQDKVPHQWWIREWLTDSTQRTILNGAASDYSAVTSGLPQGSVLGPLALDIYMMRRTKSPLRTSLQTAQSADKSLQALGKWHPCSNVLTTLFPGLTVGEWVSMWQNVKLCTTADTTKVRPTTWWAWTWPQPRKRGRDRYQRAKISKTLSLKMCHGHPWPDIESLPLQGQEGFNQPVQTVCTATWRICLPCVVTMDCGRQNCDYARAREISENDFWPEGWYLYRKTQRTENVVWVPLHLILPRTGVKGWQRPLRPLIWIGRDYTWPRHKLHTRSAQYSHNTDQHKNFFSQRVISKWNDLLATVKALKRVEMFKSYVEEMLIKN